MMVILPAAFLALSVHVLPAIAFAFPSPQTSSAEQCLTTSSCTTVLNAFSSCNIDLTSSSSYTIAQENCICTAKDFTTAIVTCFSCMGEDGNAVAKACSSYTGTSTSAVKSASTTRTASATRTSSASSSASPSSACDSTCAPMYKNIENCSISAAVLNGDSDLSVDNKMCLCNYSDFESNIAACFKCEGIDTTEVSKLCDPYTNSSLTSTASTRTSSSVRSTSTGSSNGFDTSSTASSPTSTAGSGSGSSSTGITSGTLATNLNGGAGSLAVPGLAIPALVMAAAAWRVLF